MTLLFLNPLTMETKFIRGLALLAVLTILSIFIWDLMQAGVVPNPVEAVQELSVTLDQNLRGATP
jgi:hypothetical protein